ncbi:OmpA/MotB family protein [Lachnobacterium bovis]|jgi:chemotaxis protein MotB|uniref:Chemotaxis protein MotB n=1 Tax=Lachnobacterium bovis DSM 14045 TaxID=1122142 RepID=A0A1H3EXD7_9FIRM|nr:flagellar motor protein MotB [Lachnobacterium bovis]SDX83483.1 chemotaxis protein MotB [Lachnobacterium bovis DSM 14045]
MAKKKEEEAPKGSPAWMATFSDLMNLLLCFFVLLFSMSSVDAAKFEMVISSLQSSFSILPAGGASIGNGNMVSGGVAQLEFLDTYYNAMANSKASEKADNENQTQQKKLTENNNTGTETPEKNSTTKTETQQKKETAVKEFKQQALDQSEEMAEEIQKIIDQAGMTNNIQVDFNQQYVQLNVQGALLFDSGKSDVKAEAAPILDKISQILGLYTQNTIDIEGHTDNVPISSAKYPNNNVLSMYRALSVMDYVLSKTNLNPANVKSSGRGETVPVADNGTPEGRAFNRRVEFKIYNSLSSDIK